jgi:hypothetical protein
MRIAAENGFGTWAPIRADNRTVGVSCFASERFGCVTDTTCQAPLQSKGRMAVAANQAV